MILVLEGAVMCFLLLITCVIGIANGPVGLVVLYEEDVQNRVVELGYTTKEKLKKDFYCQQHRSVCTGTLFGSVYGLLHKWCSWILEWFLADDNHSVDHGSV